MLKNIDYWKSAPLWTESKIKMLLKTGLKFKLNENIENKIVTNQAHKRIGKFPRQKNYLCVMVYLI